MTDQDENLYHFTESSPEERERYAHMAAESTRARRVRGRMLPLTGFATSLLLCLLTLRGMGDLRVSSTPLPVWPLAS